MRKVVVCGPARWAAEGASTNNRLEDYFWIIFGGELEREAISLLARTEGILVDPVYAGRALGGLIALIRAGTFAKDDKVLFWHTGGETALHAYVDDLIEG